MIAYFGARKLLGALVFVITPIEHAANAQLSGSLAIREHDASSTTPRRIYGPLDTEADMMGRGRKCVRRYGVCIASRRPSTPTSRYRAGRVDAQRRDRTIMQVAREARAREDWDDLRGAAMQEGYSGASRGSRMDVIEKGAAVLDLKTPGASEYERRRELGDLSDAERTVNRNAKR